MRTRSRERTSIDISGRKHMFLAIHNTALYRTPSRRPKHHVLLRLSLGTLSIYFLSSILYSAPFHPLTQRGKESFTSFFVLSENRCLAHFFQVLPNCHPTICFTRESLLVVGKGGQQEHDSQQPPSQKPPLPSRKWKIFQLSCVCFKECKSMKILSKDIQNYHLFNKYLRDP